MGQDAGSGSKQPTLEEVLEQFDKDAKEGKGRPSEKETYEEAQKNVEKGTGKEQGEGEGDNDGEGEGQGQGDGDDSNEGEGQSGGQSQGRISEGEGDTFREGEVRDITYSDNKPEAKNIVDAVEDAFNITRGELGEIISTKRKAMDRIRTFLNESELQQIAQKGGFSGDKTEILTIIDNALTQVYE
jgi:hypothetical protein